MATITGTAASDFLVGTDDGDLINGGLGNDTIRGLGGNDTINGAEGNDDLDGGDGNDLIIGGDGNDTIQGGKGADTIQGGAGDDVIRGGKGHDSLDGGEGNDTIYSGYGTDTLTGGAGSDVFVLKGKQDAANPAAVVAPTITDFVAGTDSIVIEDATTAEITAALAGQTTVTGGVSFKIGDGTVVVKGAGLTSLTAANVSNTVPVSVAGQTFNLTTAVDTIVGGAGADTINATLGANATLNAFDSIDGGAGVDTLSISSTPATAFTLPAAVTFKNIENVNVSHAGTAGTNAITITNTTFGTGVQKLSYTDAGTGTTDAASVALNSATDISVVAKGVAFTTVAITDKSTVAADRGATLKNVTIEKATGAATLHGNAIETVNLNAVGGLTTVNAAAGTRALTVNASGTTAQGGLTDAEATTATLTVSGAQTFGTLTVAKAGTVNINSNAATTATVVAAKAETLNIDGTNLLTLTAGAGNAALKSINVTGKGGVTVDVSAVTTLTAIDTTGSTAAAPATGTATGANTFTIGTGVAYTGGAGQDVVTVGATTKAINLGDGNDTANLSVTALGAGGSINGGGGTNTLKLSNANAETLSTANATQTAFKAAVTNFSTLDITTQSASTISLSGFGTFDTVKMVSAAAAQVFTGVASGTTFDVTFGAGGTSITTNALTAPSDVINMVMRGDLSGGARAFGELATPGAETVNLTMTDTNTTFAATLATLTVTDAAATTINISGNNGLALTHAGTALHTLNAGGLTKGAVTFTSGALTTDATVTGSATGNDTLNFAAALGKVTMTAAGGNNTLTGSSTAANTITGGTGVDKITGGSAADNLTGGAGADIIAGLAGRDMLTGGDGVDTFVYTTAATSVGAGGINVDKIVDFVAGTDKIGLTHGVGTLLGTVTLDGTSAVAAMGTVLTSATAVADLSAVYTQLANVLTAGEFALSTTTAVVARVVEFTTGDAAGKYLVINDHQAGFNAATDLVIDVTGVAGTITNSDFSFSADFFA